MKVISAEFIKSATNASHYVEGYLPEVAFAGRSNVGKSSLINKMVGRKNIARTSSTPGRTQQINFFLVNKEMHFVDLPGYGYAKIPVSVKRKWGPMVEEYLRTRKNLRMVVLILDVRRDPSPDDIMFKEWLDHYRISTIFVVTKMDKISRNAGFLRCEKIKKKLNLAVDAFFVPFSARTGEGKEGIWNIIASTGKHAD
ncbi:MAG: ribosome biogenesis GTP-binding protein YihA/YsxC [Syntrophales bacterium]|jgi:GTP-binding protein|nr:ribosome biogenesis GTP-binding protein YihA/YsxC [Syntrophales bacterium]MDY0044473.1 ribosome biogenesis GTP-binding protein YihA/YsxC [Syntrophales bacterium]